MHRFHVAGKKVLDFSIAVFKVSFRLFKLGFISVAIVGALIYFMSIPITYNLKIEGVIGVDRKVETFVMIALLSLVDGNDKVNIKINSPGGMAYVGNKIVYAIRQSEAIVVTIIEKEAASAAAYIAMAGDSLIMTKDAKIMFHRAYFVENNRKVLADDNKFLHMYNDLIANRVLPVFTPEEKKAYKKGDAIWMTGEDFITRLTKQQLMNMLNDLFGAF